MLSVQGVRGHGQGSSTAGGGTAQALLAHSAHAALPPQVAEFKMREVAIALADLPAFVEDVRRVHAATVKAGVLPYGMGLWMRFARGTANTATHAVDAAWHRRAQL